MALDTEILASALASNTRIAYDKAWKKFSTYCTKKQIADPYSASPEAVAEFLIWLSHQGLSVGSIALYKSGINRRYSDAGQTSPTHHPLVRAALKGLTRTQGAAPRRVAALREYEVAAMIALNPKEVSGHSLRAGFVTSAAVHRARLDKIMAITRHTNPATVLKYVRDADLFTDHAGQNFL